MPGACPADTVGPSPENKCYRYSTATNLTYGNALIYCSSYSNYPAIIASSAENTYYTENIGPSVNSAYLGLSDTAEEGTFVWAATGQVATYMGFPAGEPNGGSTDNCVEVNFEGLWNDLSCSTPKSALCFACFDGTALTAAGICESVATSDPTFVPSSAPTFLPSLSPTFAPSVAANATSPPSDSPTFTPSSFPSYTPSSSPSSSPTSSPTAFFPICPQFISFDDSHGSYDLWMTSFLKFDGYVAVDDDDWGLHSGYIPFMEIVGPHVTTKPYTILGLTTGPGATFSVVGGKLDANGALMPCDITADGSGACFSTRSWEIGLGAKSFFNSFFATETAAWIAPYGSSMSNECFMDSEWPVEATDTRLRPVSFTGEGRNHNNLPPPSVHVPPPLPHDSVELSLTLKDGAGQGWWNTLKFHPNQYVLDNGREILHRGTLVNKAEFTEKVQPTLAPFPPSLFSRSAFSKTALIISACWAISMSMLGTTLGP
jgi:hypothetical protein